MLAPRLRPGALVETSRVGRCYGPPATERWALRGVSLTIHPGSLVAVTGGSGAGKSTLIHLLAGLDRSDEGAVVVDGVAVSALRGRGLDRHRRRVGVIRQTNQLLPGLTVLDNVLAPTLACRRAGFDRRARAQELLAVVGLEHRSREPADHLRADEHQRLAIARAMIWRPTLLLADEPTARLDAHASRSILDLLVALHRDLAATVMIATHDHRLAARCERVLTLADGSLVDDLTLRSEDGPAAAPAAAADGTLAPRRRAAHPLSVHRNQRSG